MSTTQTTPAIGLRKFCAESGSRLAIDEPFIQDGWQYATNGIIAVRIPAAEGEPDTPPNEKQRRRPRMKDVFTPIVAADDKWTAWPHVDPCSTCTATGLVLCEECNGEGQCNQCKCKSEHECGFCDGEGKVECDLCCANGSLEHRFGNAELARKLAYLVSQLPNVQYVPQPEAEGAVRFKFDGGEGIVCSLRQS
jgi:hypothetical protein